MGHTVPSVQTAPGRRTQRTRHAQEPGIGVSAGDCSAVSQGKRTDRRGAAGGGGGGGMLSMRWAAIPRAPTLLSAFAPCSAGPRRPWEWREWRWCGAWIAAEITPHRGRSEPRQQSTQGFLWPTCAGCIRQTDAPPPSLPRRIHTHAHPHVQTEMRTYAQVPKPANSFVLQFLRCHVQNLSVPQPSVSISESNLSSCQKPR